MPKTSKATASEHIKVDGLEAHKEDFGPYTVEFDVYTADADLAPRRCQCPHLGYVVKGKLKYTFADGTDEVYEAGDAFFAPPGHTPTFYAGTEVVEFSPSAELQQTIAVVTKNMEAAGAT